MLAKKTVEAGRIPTTLAGNPPKEILLPAFDLRVTCVSMGNPHCITYVHEITDALVLGIGPKVEVDPAFPRRFTEALRPGAYLRIIVEGDVGAGDEIRVTSKPPHDLTIRDFFRIYTRDRDEVERLIAIPRVSEDWREWAEAWLQKVKGSHAHAAAPACS